MMGSWFATKEGLVTSPRSSLDKPQKRTFPTAYSTPHDAVLAELHSSPDRVASPELGTEVNSMSKNIVSPTPSFHPYLPSRLPSPDLLIDPFDGTSLGTLVPHSHDSDVQPDHHAPSQINLSSPEIGPSPTSNAVIPSELVWSHLTNIMDLQSQISKMHMEMEGIGSSKVDVKSKKHVFSHKPTPSNVPTHDVGSGRKRTGAQDHTRERGLSTASTISSISSLGGEPEGDEENVDVPSEEAEKNKAREEEFASLAQQFEGRKQAINNIMGKLDDLFSVLSEFHALQAPNLDLPASRQSSLAVTSPVNNLHPPVVADGDKKIKIPPSQASTSTRLSAGIQLQQTSTSSAVSPPPMFRTQSDNVLLEAASRKTGFPKKPMPPILLVNSIDLASEGRIHNSPSSTLGSLKLED